MTTDRDDLAERLARLNERMAILPANEPRAILRRMNRARNFYTNTCPASRHTAMISEALIKGRPYPMLVEEAGHCGGSIAATVHALWVARSKLHELGYTWTVGDDGAIHWHMATTPETRDDG